MWKSKHFAKVFARQKFFPLRYAPLPLALVEYERELVKIIGNNRVLQIIR